jgi:glycosyltransferase involved in cell wall biosynthesis
MSKKLISLIVPAFNEQDNMSRLYNEISSVIDGISKYDFEVLLIDNDSNDLTGEIAKQFCEKDHRWRYVRFSRNFGSEASIGLGLKACSGDAAMILFSDLQDPPSYLPKFLEAWENGNDIIYGIYVGKSHALAWKRWLVSVFYYLLNKVSNPPLRPYAGDFRLYDRKVIDVLNRLKERNRYLRGLAQWVGFKTIDIEYERQPRKAGKSKAPFFYLFSFAVSVIVNFSDKPLRFFSVLGILVSLAAFALSILKLVLYFFYPAVPALTTVHVLLAFNLGVISLGFGVLGEYISKIYNEVKGRPLWIVEEAVGVDIEEIRYG